MKKGGACPVSCVKKDVRERPNSVLVHLVLFSVQVGVVFEMGRENAAGSCLLHRHCGHCGWCAGSLARSETWLRTDSSGYP